MELIPPPIVRRSYLDRNLDLQQELQQQKYWNGDLLKDMRKINDECTMMRGRILLAVHTNNIKYVKEICEHKLEPKRYNSEPNIGFNYEKQENIQTGEMEMKMEKEIEMIHRIQRDKLMHDAYCKKKRHKADTANPDKTQ